MSMSAGGNDGGPMSEINVTPMVDVMLVLLIIFMITAPLMQHKVKVELPKTELAVPPEERPQPLDLAIREDGLLFLDDALVSMAELDAKLKVAAQKKPQPPLQIRADSSIHFERIWEVMSTAKGAGMVHLGFVTHSSEGDSE